MEKRSSSSLNRTKSTDFLDSISSSVPIINRSQQFIPTRSTICKELTSVSSSCSANTATSMWMFHTRNSLLSLSFSLHPCLLMFFVLLRWFVRWEVSGCIIADSLVPINLFFSIQFFSVLIRLRSIAIKKISSYNSEGYASIVHSDSEDRFLKKGRMKTFVYFSVVLFDLMAYQLF